MPNTESVPGRAVRDASVAVLTEIGETLGLIDDTQYTTPGPSGATIGAHVRHALDHYRTLAEGYATSSIIAYDQRERGGIIETDRSAAIDQAGALAGEFASLDETQMSFPVKIRAMVTGEGTEAEIDSTVVRELWFATHHTLHHNALLKPIFAHVGVDLPAEFGRAPSTVNHEKARA